MAGKAAHIPVLLLEKLCELLREQGFFLCRTGISKHSETSPVT